MVLLSTNPQSWKVFLHNILWTEEGGQVRVDTLPQVAVLPPPRLLRVGKRSEEGRQRGQRGEEGSQGGGEGRQEGQGGAEQWPLQQPQVWVRPARLAVIPRYQTCISWNYQIMEKLYFILARMRSGGERGEHLRDIEEGRDCLRQCYIAYSIKLYNKITSTI